MRCLKFKYKLDFRHLLCFLEVEMLKSKLDEFLAEMPVISAVQENDWKDAVESPAKELWYI